MLELPDLRGMGRGLSAAITARLASACADPGPSPVGAVSSRHGSQNEVRRRRYFAATADESSVSVGDAPPLTPYPPAARSSAGRVSGRDSGRPPALMSSLGLTPTRAHALIAISRSTPEHYVHDVH